MLGRDTNYCHFIGDVMGKDGGEADGRALAYHDSENYGSSSSDSDFLPSVIHSLAEDGGEDHLDVFGEILDCFTPIWRSLHFHYTSV